jgi:integrase
MASIRKRTWKSGEEEKTAWIADYSDQAGKRHIKTFSTKKAADSWLVAARGEVQRGTHTPTSNRTTVAEAGEAWIAEAEAAGLERSTVLQYRQHLDKHIKPLIGAVRLAELSTASVRDFRVRLTQKGCSAAMVRKLVSNLGSILADAMESGRVAQNVVRVQTPRQRRERGLAKRHEKRLEVGIDIPTKDEIRAMLTHAQDWFRPMIVTAIFTGLRASELRGLRWSDVDLDRAVLTVTQRADRWGIIGSPKSGAGKREVPLAPMAVNALKEWRLACPKCEADLAFPTSKGRPRQLGGIHASGLVPLQKAAGIITGGSKAKYGMHAFRHAAASMFIAEGFPPKRVQALMGHSTIQMTFDTYGHLFPTPEDDQAAMRRLQARLIG